MWSIVGEACCCMERVLLCIIYFFFQAEDGIRDVAVTGVQTCALPIFSMQSGAPTFGTPEPALVLYVMAALARRLGVPFRSGGNLCAAKTADAQAAYESAATFIPTILAGTNFVLHAAGWLRGGLAVGYQKF